MKTARENYLASILNVAEMRWAKSGVGHLPWWIQASNNRKTVADPEIPESAVDWKNRPIVSEFAQPPFVEILDVCCQATGCSANDICGLTTRREVAAARMIFA